ncbi:MAG TPA: DinB family protein [Gemmatimonadetes bacterium]|nr:DinB family protein [Gemmatimonadota bacterium]
MSNLPRPDGSEYNQYYTTYTSLVPDGEIVERLRDQLGDTLALLGGVEAERETYRYAEGKWSLREVVGHLIDTERVFAFRALSVARQDGAELPGMDQEDWGRRNNAHDRPLEHLIDEWVALRRANVHLFASFDSATGRRTGIASGFLFSVRSFAWIIAGHELWHRQLIGRDYLAESVG